MKMRKIITLVFFYGVIIISLNCQNTMLISSGNNFNFDTWRNSVLNQFDDWILNQEQFKKGFINSQMIRKQIEYVDKETFINLLNKAKEKNKLKEWTKMYVIYHFLEGEVYISLSSFIFFKGKKCWGITFDHNLDTYYEVNKDKAYKVKKIQSASHGVGNGLAIISEFTQNLKNKRNEIIVGVSSSEELKPLTGIYNKLIFN